MNEVRGLKTPGRGWISNYPKHGYTLIMTFENPILRNKLIDKRNAQNTRDIRVVSINP